MQSPFLSSSRIRNQLQGLKHTITRMLITQLTIRTWLFGFKTANDEQDHQASEKLSCYDSHFQEDSSPFASILVNVVIC